MADFIRKAAGFSAGAVLSAGLLATAAHAQLDPFAVARPPAPAAPGAPAAPAGVLGPIAPPPAASTPGNRVGFTGVEQAVGRSYAGAQTKGFASMAQIRMLPKTASPLSVSLRASAPRNMSGRPRIAVPTYAVAIVRQGSIRASAAGQGSDITPRATTISTILMGVDDTLAQRIADEANNDLTERLKAAGFDVVPQDQVQASAELRRLEVVGTKVTGANDWTIYGARSAPLRTGHPFAKGLAGALGGSGASIVLNDVSVELNAVMMTPYLVLDYARYGGSGRSTYTGSANASMETRFRMPNCGATFLYGRDKGKGGGIGGSFLSADSTGTDEAFGVLFEVDDRSDDVGLHNAFATAGLGSLYRQSKYYAVEVWPDRYATLARAAYQGFNAALVAEIQKARS